jgi:thioredoxin 2
MNDTIHVVCPQCDRTNRMPRERLRDAGKCGSCHQPLFRSHPVALDGSGRFDKHASNGDVPLLVDFWAAWCGPCRAMAPIFEQAAAQLEPEFRLVKIDTEAAPELAARFSIRSIPTLMIVHHGREIARTAGVMQLNQLVQWARQNAAGVGV